MTQNPPQVKLVPQPKQGSPRLSHLRKKQQFVITEQQYEYIKTESHRCGVSMNEILRRLLDERLSYEINLRKSEQPELSRPVSGGLHTS